MSHSSGHETIALIGGTGVVGRAIRAGSKREYVVLDRSAPDDLPHKRWVQADISRDSLAQALAGCDAMIYLATGAPDWDGLAQVDMFGLRDACEVAIQLGIPKVIYTSSNHVVGMVEQDWHDGRPSKPYLADSPCRPDSPYGVAKAFAEALCRMYAERGLLQTSCVRIGTMREIDDPQLAADEPYFGYIPGGRPGVIERLSRTWLYHDDAVALFEQELDSGDDFRVRFGYSDNPGPYWSDEVYCWNRQQDGGES